MHNHNFCKCSLFPASMTIFPNWNQDPGKIQRAFLLEMFVYIYRLSVYKCRYMNPHFNFPLSFNNEAEFSFKLLPIGIF